MPKTSNSRQRRNNIKRTGGGKLHFQKGGGNSLKLRQRTWTWISERNIPVRLLNARTNRVNIVSHDIIRDLELILLPLSFSLPPFLSRSSSCIIKGIVHPKMKIMSSFTHVPNLYSPFHTGLWSRKIAIKIARVASV